MSSGISRIILSVLLTVSLSFSMAFAETDVSAPAGQPDMPEAVTGSDISAEIPQEQTDQPSSGPGQNGISADQQNDVNQEQVHSEDASSEEESLLTQESFHDAEEPAVTEDPPEQEEEPEPVYEIEDIDGVLYYVDTVTGEKYSGKGLVSHTDDNLYCVLEGGSIAVNMTVSVDGKKYHAGKRGALIKGLHRWKDHLCFSDSNCVLKTDPGFIRVSGKRYYVRKGGMIAENRSVRVDGNIYHAGKKGVIRTGVHKWNGNIYYSGIRSGKVRKKSGFIKYNSNLYYVQKGGRIAAKKVVEVRGKYYRAYSSGRIATGVYRRGNNYYFSDPGTGEWIRTKKFRKWKKKLYFIQEDGTLAANKVFADKNQAYYADAKCRVKSLKVSNPSSRILAAAQSQVGIMTGEKYWKWYFGTRFVDTDVTPWCGTFVGWCYDQAGMYDRISSVGNTAYVPCYTWFANRNGRWIAKASARSGDIVVFGRDRHVGIVERIYKGYLITIEGNSGPTAAYGCGLPGAVTRRVYSIHDEDIKGIIHP